MLLVTWLKEILGFTNKYQLSVYKSRIGFVDRIMYKVTFVQRLNYFNIIGQSIFGECLNKWYH